MTNGEKILKELNSFSKNTAQDIPAKNPGDEDLPFESLDDYSLDPIGFEETAAMINEKVERIFELSAKYNHRSAEYLEICGFLERGIKYLGSVCLTKTLMKFKKYTFPQLDELTTHRLYAMVSFNLRKLNRTVNELLAADGELPGKWLDMQFRYANLTERLKSTETKIYDNFVGLTEGEIEDTEKRELMFTEKAWNRHYVRKYVKKPVFRKAPAFPLLPAAKSINADESRKNPDTGNQLPDERPIPEDGEQETGHPQQKTSSAGSETAGLPKDPAVQKKPSGNLLQPGKDRPDPVFRIIPGRHSEKGFISLPYDDPYDEEDDEWDEDDDDFAWGDFSENSS